MDEDKIGSKSDHKIVVVRPINSINNRCARQTKQIIVRPFPESGLKRMKTWFMKKTWEDVYSLESAHEKAELFQNILLQKLDEIFPEKMSKINSDDQPWISNKLKRIDRRRKRIFRRERKSEKWKNR